LEAQYNTYLEPHKLPPTSFAQVLAPTTAADSITLTLQPALQRIARNALAGRDGAAVVLDPRTGAVLAMYSNPNYDPTPLESGTFLTAAAYWKKITTPDAHHFEPLGLVATQQSFPPGSSFKVITTSAAIIGRPDLLVKKYPNVVTIKLPNSNKTLSNFGFGSCGGDVAAMLPPSCDTGYALLGMDLGGSLLASTAGGFGFNQVPPLDLPGVQAATFPTTSFLANNLPGVAYSAIGQQDVRETALQNALVAAAIGNHGVMMTPHLLNYITDPYGTVIKRYGPKTWLTPLTDQQSSQLVPLMQNVVKYGTAYGIFPTWLNAAAKTGTAQVGNAVKNTDDWLIAFAPADHPTIAVAVVLPFQDVSRTGAEIAGPVVKCLMEGAYAIQHGRKPTGTSTTCPR
jgi:peptidoglycan glycosyltransferase